MGGLEFGEASELGACVLGDDGHHVGVSRKACAFGAEAVSADYVEILFLELGLGIFD